MSVFFGWSQIGNRLTRLVRSSGLDRPQLAAAVQRIELTDAPGEKSEVEDPEIETEAGQLRVAKDDLVDERGQCRFHNYGRIEEIFKRRTVLPLWPAGVHDK